MERGRRDGGKSKRIRIYAGDIFSIAIKFCQAGATVEGIVADAGHATWDGDRGQAGATRKGWVADAGHATRDGDRGQAAATSEGTIAYAGHALGDGDGGQATATTVFVNYFISTTCVLNGRKVMT